MTAWLHIIGVGEAGISELPDSVRAILGYSETVLGPARFLHELEPMIRAGGTRTGRLHPEVVDRRGFEAVARALGGAEDELPPNAVFSEGRMLIEWEPPLERMLEQLLKLRDSPTAILATGDPMWFGIGSTLARHLLPEEFEIYPFPSAFQLAASHLHWPLQSVSTLSLHGRPIELLNQHLLPANRILALTTDRLTLDNALEILLSRGYGQSQVWTLENLGAAGERITTGTAANFETRGVEDFYVLAIECVAEIGAPLLPPLPGLPDDAFITDGQLTKREVRAITLARLAPFPGAMLWDVGAGSGSVAIEWLRAARDSRAIAFERDGERLQRIALNAAQLGVPHLQVESGEAPGTMALMPAPDAIFIGGDVGNEHLFDACWQALKPGGRMVVNAVTLEGEQALYARQERLGGDLVRIDVAAIDRLGPNRVMRPRLPVTQWAVVKAVHGDIVDP